MTFLRTLPLLATLAAAPLLSPSPATAQVSCSDFSSRDAAQRIYDGNPDLYGALDSDGDGAACEDLPGGGAIPLEDSEDGTGLTCEAFDSRREAQKAYDADRDANVMLDQDRDGIACEFNDAPRTAQEDGNDGTSPDADRPNRGGILDLNTWDSRGVGVAPRRDRSTTEWPGTETCPNFRYSTGDTCP